MASQARQNYHQECEAAVNIQINRELYSSYLYGAVAFYFDRDDVALPGFHKFFKELSDVEREDAHKLMKFQNERGGRIVLQDVKRPPTDEWGSGEDACQMALANSKATNQAILELHQTAAKHGDDHMTDFLEGGYMHKEVERLKKISEHITNLKRVGSGVGEFLFDKHTLE